MEKITRRKQAVLDVLDEQIDELEEKLKKVQPLINELNSLRATRARLLDERTPTARGGGGSRNGTKLTMEPMIHDLRQHGSSMVNDISARVGVDATVVRSYLNRYKDLRYRQDADTGEWALIGPGDDDEEDDE